MTKRILIMAAGTGGHVFPALAIARALKEKGAEVEWLGTKKGFEKKLLRDVDIPFHQISITGIRGNGLKRLLFSPINIFRAFLQSLKIIQKIKPDVVLGMGGFVCGPGAMAACVLRKRLVIHEQNAVPGMTNKILKHFAKTIFTAFPDVLLSKKTKYVGNPIRHDIVEISVPEERFSNRSGSMRLLVFGGSQGALSFSSVLPQALALLPKTLSVEVWHQAGEKNIELAKKYYDEFKVKAKIVPFIHEMAAAYQWADLVVCRSGATTVSEMSAVGLPAIFIPYPFHKDDQQGYNARFLVDANAAIMIRQADFTPENLAAKLEELLSDRAKLLKMAKSGRELRKVEAVGEIVKELEGGSDYA